MQKVKVYDDPNLLSQVFSTPFWKAGVAGVGCFSLKQMFKNVGSRDFLGGPVAKTPHSRGSGPSFDLWLGN